MASVIDLTGNVIKADTFEGAVDASASIEAAVAAKTEIAALTSDLSEAAALNSTFSDVEVETALNAIAVKVNAIIDALKA
jgi:hypothetical protein